MMRTIKRKYLLATIASFISLSQLTEGHAVTLTAFAPSVYDPITANMDVTLGITGYTIENFEDVTLVSGLSIELNNPDSPPSTDIPHPITITH